MVSWSDMWFPFSSTVNVWFVLDINFESSSAIVSYLVGIFEFILVGNRVTAFLGTLASKYLFILLLSFFSWSLAPPTSLNSLSLDVIIIDAEGRNPFSLILLSLDLLDYHDFESTVFCVLVSTVYAGNGCLLLVECL